MEHKLACRQDQAQHPTREHRSDLAGAMGNIEETNDTIYSQSFRKWAKNLGELLHSTHLPGIQSEPTTHAYAFLTLSSEMRVSANRGSNS